MYDKKKNWKKGFVKSKPEERCIRNQGVQIGCQFFHDLEISGK